MTKTRPVADETTEATMALKRANHRNERQPAAAKAGSVALTFTVRPLRL